ncbi:ROK family protein [Mariprofundus ferrinatatus]|nr:ROK family protein [Mariprofundus ferrinatatus]
MNVLDKNGLRIGIDLGGSKIELIAMDRDGNELLRFRRATPAKDYMATVKTVAEMVGEADRELAAAASIGIGTPGAISLKTGLMKNCNSTCLNGQMLKEDIEAELRREVRMSNDANCFALSEAVDGAAAGAGVVFGVILGTGVGGGIVVNGHVLSGINSIAGEWGHNPLPSPFGSELTGHGCYCGRKGCIETWLSGPAMADDHLRSGGGLMRPDEIAAGVEQGDPLCRFTLERYCDRLARALAGVINILDPDVIVLGGGLSNIKMLYDQVPKLWGRYIFSDEVTTQLLPPKHGDSSGVRGAAWLWGHE